MPGPRAKRTSLRFVLGGALLAGAYVLSASCVEAIDADGYRDAYVTSKKLVERCYGHAYVDFDRKLDELSEDQRIEWRDLAAAIGCLNDCTSLRYCLDFPLFCEAPITGGGTACDIDEQCCGFTQGNYVCRDGACCQPLGTFCTADTDCCLDAGFCSKDTFTCGGVLCGYTGMDCLNDFQCCSGNCTDAGRCGDTPCAQAGYACTQHSDCCGGLCDLFTLSCKECTEPGHPCQTSADCCNKDAFECKAEGNGTFCLPKTCSPDNYDCQNDDQCCSGYCAPAPYHLCGECHQAGEPCNFTVPCCTGLICHDSGVCGPP